MSSSYFWLWVRGAGRADGEMHFDFCIHHDDNYCDRPRAYGFGRFCRDCFAVNAPPCVGDLCIQEVEEKNIPQPHFATGSHGLSRRCFIAHAEKRTSSNDDTEPHPVLIGGAAAQLTGTFPDVGQDRFPNNASTLPFPCRLCPDRRGNLCN